MGATYTTTSNNINKSQYLKNMKDLNISCKAPEINYVMYQQCTICLESKSHDEYHKNSQKSNGLNNACKECVNSHREPTVRKCFKCFQFKDIATFHKIGSICSDCKKPKQTERTCGRCKEVKSLSEFKREKTCQTC